MDNGRRLRDSKPTSGSGEKGPDGIDYGCTGWGGMRWELRTVWGPLSTHFACLLPFLHVSILFSGTQALLSATCCLGDLRGQGKGKILIFFSLESKGKH